MKDRPFGEGIGLAGVEARKYGNRYITTFPVDSYYVKIWVQTGIVGLILHIAVLLICLFWGCYLIHVQSEEYRISRYTYRFYMRTIWINVKCIRKSVFRTAQYAIYPMDILCMYRQ